MIGENKDFWKKKTILSYFLAVLVMWSHCSCFTYYKELPNVVYLFSIFFKRVINPVAVPLFFIISGALFFRDYTNSLYVGKIKNRIRTLIIPFFVWNIINMCFHIFVSAFFSQYFNVREKFDFSIKNILLGIVHYEYNFPFWFIFSLIIFTIFAPALDVILKNKYVGAIAIGLLIVLNFFEIGLPVPFFYNRTCIIFYMVGGLIGRHYQEFFYRKSSKAEEITGVIFIFMAWIYEFTVHTDLIKGNALADVIVLIIFGIGVWKAADAVVYKIPKKEIFNHSFWVYALHINVSSIIAKLIYFAGPKGWVMAIPNFILTTILSILVIEIMCRIIKKLNTNIYGVLSGTR